MAGQREITAEEIASWYTPREAAAYAAEIVGDYGSRDAVWKRMVAGLIEAATSHSTVEDPGKPIVTRVAPHIVPNTVWELYSDQLSDFWGAGDATFFAKRRSAYDKSSIVKYLGVKLNPAHVHATIPRPSTAATTEPTDAPDTDPIQKGPPISPIHLQAWFEFYKKIGGEMREEAATDHVHRCFPNHSVTRKRIRDLLPERPMGRPKTREDND